MSIKRRIQIVFAIVLLFVAGNGLVFIWNAGQVETGMEHVGLDSRMLRATFMLRILLEEYLATGGDRPKIQWEKQYLALGAILRERSSVAGDRKIQALIEKIRQDYGEVGSLFTQLVNTGTGTGPEDSRSFRDAVRDMLSNRLESISADAVALHTQTSQSTISAQRTGQILTTVFTLLMVIVLGINLYSVNKAILRPLDELAAGATIIGNGDFNHVIEVHSDDEFGHLSEVFNVTTEKLRSFYSSLEKEIRERKHKEKELLRSNEDLEQFAYVASHDLQEPLRNVSSAMQLLEKRYKGKLGPDADQFVGYAVDSAKAMKKLIEDLLAYSRIGTRGNPFRVIQVEQVLEGALANLRSTIFQGAAEITHDPLPELVADPAQLTLVFQNLLSNAVKFRRQDRPQIHVSACKDDDSNWVFSVKDNGIGIEERHVDRIFLIFQRLHKKTEYEGTGIGLAIAKRIVERHGGRIWAASEIGKGTTMYFTIPFCGGATTGERTA